jgi:hypothetical protein
MEALDMVTLDAPRSTQHAAAREQHAHAQQRERAPGAPLLAAPDAAAAAAVAAATAAVAGTSAQHRAGSQGAQGEDGPASATRRVRDNATSRTLSGPAQVSAPALSAMGSSQCGSTAGQSQQTSCSSDAHGSEAAALPAGTGGEQGQGQRGARAQRAAAMQAGVAPRPAGGALGSDQVGESVAQDAQGAEKQVHQVAHARGRPGRATSPFAAFQGQ